MRRFYGRNMRYRSIVYGDMIVGGLGTYAQNMAPIPVAKGLDVTLFAINPGDLLTSEVHQGVEILLSATKFVNDACGIAWGVGSRLDDMDEAVLMGKRERKLVERHLTWDTVADSAVEVYGDVMANGRKY